MVYKVALAAPADRDFIEIMNWSAEQFGAIAADRYEELINQALIDVGKILLGQVPGSSPSCRKTSIFTTWRAAASASQASV